jgi:hypothetical protein
MDQPSVKAPTQTIASVAKADTVTIAVHRAAPGCPNRIKVPKVQTQHPRQIISAIPNNVRRISLPLIPTLIAFLQCKAHLTKVKLTFHARFSAPANTGGGRPVQNLA